KPAVGCGQLPSQSRFQKKPPRRLRVNREIAGAITEALIMHKNQFSESGIFVPRVFLALFLVVSGLSLGVVSFAAGFSKANITSSTTATSAIPGFHSPVTMPGSTGGTEPSLAIKFDGTRYVSWQAPGEFARSSDGVN